MTEAEALSLGRRWVAAMGDKAWAAGMLDLGGWRCINVPEGVFARGGIEPLTRSLGRPPSHAPDLRDPATLGAALGVLREVWASPELIIEAFVRHQHGAMWWTIDALDVPAALDAADIEASTEAEALVVAAEAAKERE